MFRKLEVEANPRLQVPVKEREIIHALLEIVNAGKQVVLEDDWGDNSLTLSIRDVQQGVIDHCHYGVPEGTYETMIDHMHASLVENRGLSWHREVTAQRGGEQGGRDCNDTRKRDPKLGCQDPQV